MSTILVAIDASPLAETVLRGAIAVARRFGGRLVLLRAVALPVDLPASFFTVSTDSALTLLTERAKHDLDEVAKSVPAELLERVQVRVGGAPWEAICDAAREGDAAMIVIGSHGHGGVARFLGTIASKVVDHADRSVLVVRAPELFE